MDAGKGGQTCRGLQQMVANGSEYFPGRAKQRFNSTENQGQQG
jgi:hypothetical protein